MVGSLDKNLFFCQSQIGHPRLGKVTFKHGFEKQVKRHLRCHNSF